MKKRILVYGMGIFLTKIIVFLLVPIYTRCFDPADYGYYDVIVSNMTMIVSISFLEIWSGILRFMLDDSRKYKPIKSLISILPVLLGIYLAGFMILSNLTEVRFRLLSFIFGISYFLFSVYNNICRGLNKNIDYIISGAISAVISCSLGVFFSVVCHKGIEFLLISQICGYFGAVIYVELKTRSIKNAFGEKADKRLIREMIMYCFPLMINSFSYLFLETYNKNLVAKILGNTYSGYYAFVLKFTAMLSVLISIFSLAWQEEAFSNANHADRGIIFSGHINRFCRFVGLAVPIYIIFLYYFAPVVGGQDYGKAVGYIPIAMMGTFAASLSGIVSVVIAVSKKTLPVLLSTVVGAAVNVIAATLLIPKFGVQGSNISLVLAFTIIALYRYLAGMRRIKYRIDIRILMLLGLEIMISVLAYHLADAIFLITVFGAFVCVWLIMNMNYMKDTLRQVRGLMRK